MRHVVVSRSSRLLLLFPLRTQLSVEPPPTDAATTAPPPHQDPMARAAPTHPITVRGLLKAQTVEGTKMIIVSWRQLGALFARCLTPLAPAAPGCPATTTTSSPPSVCTSGLAVAMATATTLPAWKSVRGRVRFLSRANRTLVRPILPEKPVAPTGPRLLRADPQVEAHETWGGSSQSTEPPAAAPADRPRVQPRTLTEEDSTCATAGLSLLPRLSRAALQPGKHLMKGCSGSQPASAGSAEPPRSLQRSRRERSRGSTSGSGVHRGHHHLVSVIAACSDVICSLPLLF